MLTFISMVILALATQNAEANIKGELCTDISTYTPVEWHEGSECCKRGVGTPDCQVTTKEACVKYEERICQVEIQDKFEMEECPLNTTMIVREEQTFQPWKAVPVPHSILHTKHNFTCVNRTRLNCETVWVTNSVGEKESVPGACEEVVWLECSKTPYEATYETIKHEKVSVEPMKYSTCFEMIVVNTQMCFRVKRVPVSICSMVPGETCRQVETKFCEPKAGPVQCVPAAKVPWQQRVHKEKCLDPGLPPHQDHDIPPNNVFRHTPPPPPFLTPTPSPLATTTEHHHHDDPFWNLESADILTRYRGLKAGKLSSPLGKK